MATKEEIQQLLDAIKGALSAKFEENDKRFTTLINGLELDAIFCARVKIFNA
jgi:predicted transcriptional regulator